MLIVVLLLCADSKWCSGSLPSRAYLQVALMFFFLLVFLLISRLLFCFPVCHFVNF